MTYLPLRTLHLGGKNDLMKLRTFTAKLKKAKGLSSQTKSNTMIGAGARLTKEQGKSLRTPAFALKGRNEIAQGNAMGKSRHKTPALKGRKTSVADYSALSGLI